MVAARWLDVYATEAGVERALAGLDRRARFTDDLHHAVADLRAHRAALQRNFERLFGALQRDFEDRSAGCPVTP